MPDLTDDERLSRLERAVTELYDRSRTSGSATFGWLERETLEQIAQEVRTR